MQSVDLMGMTKAQMTQYFTEQLEAKPFHARQVFKWIHQRGVTDFERMTDLSKKLRADLQQHAVVQEPTVLFSKASPDGTHKFLIQVGGGNAIEVVYIPEAKRGTLCVSSQVGCTLNCSFCSTGKQGFNRNLTIAEVIGQVWTAVRALEAKGGEQKVTNVVMMGMGEPLMNYEHVIPAMGIMLDDDAYGLSKRRVTLSTSGVVPRIDQMLEEIGVSLAVSLHAPTDELRDELVPINRKYPIDQLLKACQRYAQHGPHKHITFEYTLMDQVNDSIEHAQALIDLLASYQLPSKINLIPFNPYPGTPYKKPSNNRIHRFYDYLNQAGLIATIRKTRGDAIDAACGQLVGQVQDKTKRQARYNKERAHEQT